MIPDQSQIATGLSPRGSEPATKYGLAPDEVRYMQGGVEPAAPSIINTNSKFLNNPFYRDAYAQIALRRNGPDLPSTYIIPLASRAIGEVTDYAKFQRLIDDEKAHKPEFAQWLRERRHTPFRPQDLIDHAPGTLGHTIREFLVGSGYSMEQLQMAGVQAANDIDYISQRRAAVHDIEHMVTGFGTNACGEKGLVWSNIASLFTYFSPELAHEMSAGLVFLSTATLQQYSLHYPAAFAATLEAVRSGIEMGQSLKRPLLLEPWEDMLDWQIEDIASHLGIERGPGKAWDWTTAATSG